MVFYLILCIIGLFFGEICHPSLDPSDETPIIKKEIPKCPTNDLFGYDLIQHFDFDGDKEFDIHECRAALVPLIDMLDFQQTCHDLFLACNDSIPYALSKEDIDRCWAEPYQSIFITSYGLKKKPFCKP